MSRITEEKATGYRGGLITPKMGTMTQNHLPSLNFTDPWRKMLGQEIICLSVLARWIRA